MLELLLLQGLSFSLLLLLLGQFPNRSLSFLGRTLTIASPGRALMPRARVEVRIRSWLIASSVLLLEVVLRVILAWLTIS